MNDLRAAKRGAALLGSILLLALLLNLGTPLPSVRAAEGNPPVVVAGYDGAVVPITAKYLERVIRHAENLGATACVIQLSTPGGLYTTTQEIVTTILNARVPVIVYVSPAGGWAGSAGTFITISAHVAAMAPGSRIGAAHPVGIGPSDGQQQDVPSQKITEDAAAWARSIAQLRGKNADAVEQAVRESKSYSDAEALKLNLIDLRAQDLEDLLRQVDGKKVALSSGAQVKLRTKGAPIVNLSMNPVEKALLALSNPDLAYILMTVGMAGLMVEIYHPGLIFPGVAGAISLLLGLYSLGTLDAYWGGVLLIILAFGLFIAEAFVPSHGILGAGGVISFVTGSLLLFSGGPPGIGISISLIVTTALVFAALVALLVTAVVRGQKRAVTTGSEGLIGRTGTARSDLLPEGLVFVEGELWRAVSEEGTIKAGEKVVITAMEGLNLRVRRA
ncbi:MAG: Nodulation efficiency protein NfeD [Thermacetogenium phaeum]|uniref:Nodulation efficiency protein NfeD n=1 Tax=Thermacetogenium phaeum TaxID=85874 RepID=A0A101FGX1_9THEO|nr:MAG: Nodulation efficiency protein NfeD [Thermacetogenium phaeum]